MKFVKSIWPGHDGKVHVERKKKVILDNKWILNKPLFTIKLIK